jgi:hypothetical protein
VINNLKQVKTYNHDNKHDILSCFDYGLMRQEHSQPYPFTSISSHPFDGEAIFESYLFPHSKHPLKTSLFRDYPLPNYLSIIAPQMRDNGGNTAKLLIVLIFPLIPRKLTHMKPNRQENINELAQQRAEELLQDHRRIREVAEYQVTPCLPVEVMGGYILLPEEL